MTDPSILDANLDSIFSYFSHESILWHLAQSVAHHQLLRRLLKLCDFTFNMSAVICLLLSPL